MNNAMMTVGNARLDSWEGRARRRYGDKLDLSEVLTVSPDILKHFDGARIEVQRTYGDGEVWTRRGRVSVSTGWRPCILLMARVTSRGSSDVLDGRDRLVRVIAP